MHSLGRIQRCTRSAFARSCDALARSYTLIAAMPSLYKFSDVSRRKLSDLIAIRIFLLVTVVQPNTQ